MENNTLFKLISGRAGTGKTYLAKQLCENDPSFGILASSTGISAVNLGTTTINSLLRFFNTESLQDKFIEGKLQASLRQIAKNYNYILLDEVSMTPGEQLDIIVSAIEQVNNYETVEKPLGLIVLGDAAQLPPVSTPSSPAKWFFEAECWKEKFQSNIEFLTKIWRQDNLAFIEALEFARLGQGLELLEHLRNLKVEFNNELDTNFEGTTIFAKNQQVDNYNQVRLARLQGKLIQSTKKVEGKLLGEWNKIPDILDIKIGSYVMILVNKPLGYESGIATGFEYSNGDCGIVKDYNSELDQFTIELVRNSQEVKIGRINRYNETKNKPSVFEEEGLNGFESYYDEERKRYILGLVSFHPIRLAWGITTHKSQGLTLDKVQLDFRNHFFSSPNMLYVALSRARTIEGIRLIGKESLISKRCNIDPKVLDWFKEIQNGN